MTEPEQHWNKEDERKVADLCSEFKECNFLKDIVCLIRNELDWMLTLLISRSNFSAVHLILRIQLSPKRNIKWIKFSLHEREKKQIH